MKIIITGRNVDLTDAIKDRANDKLSKLDKFFTNETTATVTLKKENGKDVAEINIPVKGNLLRVSEKQDNLFAAIDTATEKLTEIKIVKKKQVLLKPMDEEEACMQLDMIGHSFFIYENTNGKICVAYKRGDGHFGIIESDIE